VATEGGGTTQRGASGDVESTQLASIDGASTTLVRISPDDAMASVDIGRADAIAVFTVEGERDRNPIPTSLEGATSMAKAAPDIADATPLRSATVGAPGAVTIVDPVMQASLRDAAPGRDNPATLETADAPTGLMTTDGATALEGPQTAGDLAASPWAAIDSTGRTTAAADAGNASVSEAGSNEWTSAHRATSDLDRRIELVSDAWFATESRSGQIALTHFDEILRGDLGYPRRDAAADSDDLQRSSYARQWQRMRLGLTGFDRNAADGAWGWQGGTAMTRGILPVSDDDVDSNAFIAARSGRFDRASMPMFSGLQDGFERL